MTHQFAPPMSAQKAEDLARLAPVLQSIATSRRGFMLAPIIVALQASRISDPAQAIDPNGTQVTLPDQFQWKPELPGAPSRSVETVPVFGATDKPGPYVVLLKWRGPLSSVRNSGPVSGPTTRRRPLVLCFGPDRIQLHQSLADTVLNAAQGNTNFGLNRRASLRPYLRGAEGEIPSAYSPICFQRSQFASLLPRSGNGSARLALLWPLPSPASSTRIQSPSRSPRSSHRER